MPIKGMTTPDALQYPRLGYIKSGVSRESAKVHGIQIPDNRAMMGLDYFVCDSDDETIRRAFKDAYGEKPKAVNIIFLDDNMEATFPCYLKSYGKSAGLKCKGDGEKAQRASGEFKGGREIWEDRECPCDWLEQKQCKAMGTLTFFIPEISNAGVFQLHTTSYNAIKQIVGALSMSAGRIANYPYRLILQEKEMHPVIGGKKANIKGRYAAIIRNEQPEEVAQLIGKMREKYLTIRNLISGESFPVALETVDEGQDDLLPESSMVDVIESPTLMERCQVIADMIENDDGARDCFREDVYSQREHVTLNQLRKGNVDEEDLSWTEKVMAGEPDV